MSNRGVKTNHEPDHSIVSPLITRVVKKLKGVSACISLDPEERVSTF